MEKQHLLCGVNELNKSRFDAVYKALRNLHGREYDSPVSGLITVLAALSQSSSSFDSRMNGRSGDSSHSLWTELLSSPYANVLVGVVFQCCSLLSSDSRQEHPRLNDYQELLLSLRAQILETCVHNEKFTQPGGVLHKLSLLLPFGGERLDNALAQCAVEDYVDEVARAQSASELLDMANAFTEDDHGCNLTSAFSALVQRAFELNAQELPLPGATIKLMCNPATFDALNEETQYRIARNSTAGFFALLDRACSPCGSCKASNLFSCSPHVLNMMRALTTALTEDSQRCCAALDLYIDALREDQSGMTTHRFTQLRKLLAGIITTNSECAHSVIPASSAGLAAAFYGAQVDASAIGSEDVAMWFPQDVVQVLVHKEEHDERNVYSSGCVSVHEQIRAVSLLFLEQIDRRSFHASRARRSKTRSSTPVAFNTESEAHDAWLQLVCALTYRKINTSTLTEAVEVEYPMNALAHEAFAPWPDRSLCGVLLAVLIDQDPIDSVGSCEEVVGWLQGLVEAASHILAQDSNLTESERARVSQLLTAMTSLY